MINNFYAQASTFRITVLLGCAFYIFTFSELIILDVVNLNAGYFDGKWRFTEPSWLTWGYTTASLSFFLIASALFAKRPAPKRVVYTETRYEVPSRRLFAIAILALLYVILSNTVFDGNYRTDSNSVGKLVMQPIYTLTYSTLLLWILVFPTRFGESSKISAVLCLIIGVSLAISVTGAGAAATLIGCAILLLLGKGSKLRGMVLVAFALFVAFFSMLIFLAKFKYSLTFQLMSVREIYDLATDLTSWVFARLLVVTGASVFLIEQAELTNLSFGPSRVVEIFGSNLGKAGLGDFGKSEYRSLGEFVYSHYYIGSRDVSYGVSPGLLGGMTLLAPVYLAAPLSGLLVFTLSALVSIFWMRALNSPGLLKLFIFYYFFVQFFFFNPYSMLSIIDPAFARFSIFLLTPIIMLRRVPLRRVNR